ncbi:M48 family metallopeptidase [Aestuariivirga litoralis]|uniref:M48 family metallopeptidase n=1 Tax=Aestuariivirga litoralis TaxID=2650924 RepID=UPI0018C5BC13|nr:M48 family metallopeptidase [Aestuariivirga litoralis]MBG1231648.1 M48 family metallopeptidase [Aestuariivirga litoralis]
MAVSATYFDGQSAKSHEVHVSEDGQQLTFSGADVAQVSWTIAGLHAIDPPSPGQPYRLTHEGAPGARLIIRDQDFITQLTARSRHLHGGYTRKDITQLLGWTLGGIAVFVLLGWIAVSVLPAPIARAMPQSWRQSTGIEMEKAMAGGKVACSTTAGDRAIGQLLANLAEGVPDMPPVSVHVYDLGMLNAFAVNGGHIIVTKQLLDAADRPEELAGVLAHEIGHVAHLHPEAQMVRLAGVQILSSTFSGTNGGNMSSNAIFIATVLRHSRAAEEEADAYARDMLVKSQIDPMGFKTFFEKLLKLEGGSSSQFSALKALGSIFSTHPGTEERIAKIKPLPEGVVAKPALTPEEWQALKKICG